MVHEGYWASIMAFTQDVIEPDVREAIGFSTDRMLSDEPQMETYFHLRQMILLLTSLEWYWRARNDFFAAGNLTIYYSRRQRKNWELTRQICSDCWVKEIAPCYGNFKAPALQSRNQRRTA